MKIKRIELCNFGSYSGDNRFHFETDNPEERVVVIGGKNGSGKTTLFTAVQVCLYGNFAFGYKSAGKRYLDEIYHLINNQVKMEEGASSHIEIAFQHVDNTDLFDYRIRRSWAWPRSEIRETVSVWRNGIPLPEDECLNFQSYLLHLIPPDMLKLYFFDGEKIADYFLSDKEVNIRDSLMVLSGNDTFDLLYDQVRRVVKISGNAQDDIAHKYLTAQAAAEEARRQAAGLEREIESCREAIEEAEAEVNRHAEKYADHGGITMEEWAGLQNQLKAEEEKRERLNGQRKEAATDSLPFAMLAELVAKVPPQLQAEKDYQMYCALKSTLEERQFTEVLAEAVRSMGSGRAEEDARLLLERISGYLLDRRWEGFEPLFSLSRDEEEQLQSVFRRVKAFDPSVFKRSQKDIHASLERSREIRARLQNTSVENFEGYAQNLSALEEKLKINRLKKEHIQELLDLKREELAQKEDKLRALKKAFEKQLKVQSVSAVSGRVLLLLEELQGTLYAKLIRRVEEDLNKKFRELIRKEDFFSHIHIDDRFTVHILRNEQIQTADLLSLLRAGGLAAAAGALGETAMEALKDRYAFTSAADLRKALAGEAETQIQLPVELSKDRLSSGEKQIFVMSLYWAMMNQSSNELPFIIDTPFARIDAEHRENITEYFFKKLTGQLIILSTDEELSNRHLEAMGKQVSHMYMLEYGRDKRTHIYENQYFEV